jgi:putative phosphoesterase
LSLTLGLIADTHVPDRRRDLHPGALRVFREAKVAHILHAGDISVPRVLAELEQIAPVTAVRGNRDWVGFADLRYHRSLEFEGVKVGLTHGHGSWSQYIQDKLRFVIFGPQFFEHYMSRAVSLMKDADVVIFGHNHEPMVKDFEGKLVVNPGSACCQVLPGKPPTVALLHLDAGKARAEIVELI